MWTSPLDGQAVRGRQTGAGTLIYFVTTGWPSGLTGATWKKGYEHAGGGQREVGSHSRPRGLRVAPSVHGDMETLRASAAAVSRSENTGAITPINMRWS